MSTLERVNDKEWTFWASSIRLPISSVFACSDCVPALRLLRNIRHSLNRQVQTSTSGDFNSSPCSTLCSHFSRFFSRGDFFLFIAIPLFAFFVIPIFPSFFFFFSVHHPLPSHPRSHTHPPPVTVYRSCRLRRCCYLRHVSLRLLKAASAVSPIDWLLFSFGDFPGRIVSEQTLA